jgi:hypothetical protein
MADNDLVVQSSTLGTVPVGAKPATRDATYAGDAGVDVPAGGLVTFTGSDDAKTATDVPGGGGVEAAALRVTIASDSTGLLSVDDNGGSLTVDGTVAVSGTVAVTDNGGNLSVDDGAGSLTVDSAQLPGALAAGGGMKIEGVAGGVVVPVADGGGSLTVDGTVAASNLPATVDTNSGNKSASTLRVVLATDQPQNTTALKVDGSAVAQPVTDNSGSLTVDSTQLPAALAANGGLKIEGVASGVAVPVSVASIPSHAVTNAGTFAVQDSDKIADDAAFGVASSKVQPSGYLADETATDSVDEGDVGIARMTLDRKQHVVEESESNSMRISGVAVTPKFAKIAVSSSGVNIVVAAVTSKKIRVLSYVLVANAAVNVKWQSHTTPTDLTGLDYLAANTGVSSGYSPVGHFESLSGESLDLNLSGAVAVGGHLTYIEV